MVKQVADRLWWDSKNRRWSIKYLGKSYCVSCRQLRAIDRHVEDSQHGSEDAARRWWEEKRCAVDQERLANQRDRATQQGIKCAIDNAIAQQRRCVRLGNSADAAFWSRFGNDLRRLAEVDSSADLFFDPETGRFNSDSSPPTPSVVLTALARFFDLLQADKLDAETTLREHPLLGKVQTKQQAQPEAVHKTAELVERYMRNRRSEVDSGQLSLTYFDTLRKCLAHFASFVGNSNAPAAINASVIEEYRNHVLSARSRERKPKGAEQVKERQPWSESFKKRHFIAARQFVGWLYKSEIIDREPRNLDLLTVTVPPAEIKTFAIEQLKPLLSVTDEHVRLWFLLMLNTGGTQKDLSDLRPDEVDWNAGRILRKRSKTHDFASVLVVNYKLWPETFKLLREIGHRSGAHVLLNKRGRPLVSESLDENSKHTKSDAIKCAYFRLSRANATLEGLSLKHLRKTGASLLANEFDDAIAERYLGHSARSVAGKHYIKRDQERFDSAIAWLGEKLGIVERNEP